jgi:hypothetical protein
MLCGNFFITLIRGAFREKSQSSARMMFGSSAVFLEILQYAKMGKSDEMVDEKECKAQCDYLRYQPLPPEGVFSKQMWNKYFGEVGAEPPLPWNIDKIMGDFESPFLVMIPATINGKPFCLDLLGKLLVRPKKGFIKAKYDSYDLTIKDLYGQKSPDQSYWFLIERKVIKGSLGNTRDQQVRIASSKEGCQVPDLLEAATAIMTHYIATKECFLLDNVCYSITCLEQWDSYRTTVCAFSGAGLHIGIDYFDHPNNGVSFSRRF